MKITDQEKAFLFPKECFERANNHNAIFDAKALEGAKKLVFEEKAEKRVSN